MPSSDCAMVTRARAAFAAASAAWYTRVSAGPMLWPIWHFADGGCDVQREQRPVVECGADIEQGDLLSGPGKFPPVPATRGMPAASPAARDATARKKRNGARAVY